MKVLAIFAISMLLCLVVCSPPVPKAPEGYLYKPAPLAKARLDIYEDLLCGDCKNFDPPFKAFLNTQYKGRPITDYVEVVFHTYILPIHINAFTLSQISPFLWDLHRNGTINAAYNEWCFEHQAEFRGVAGDNMSQIDVMNKVCSDTDGLFGYTKDQCLKMYADQTYQRVIHNEQKYGAYYRVYTTPGVFLNGVQLDDIPATAAAWTKFITPYIQ